MGFWAFFSLLFARRFSPYYLPVDFRVLGGVRGPKRGVLGGVRGGSRGGPGRVREGTGGPGGVKKGQKWPFWVKIRAGCSTTLLGDGQIVGRKRGFWAKKGLFWSITKTQMSHLEGPVYISNSDHGCCQCTNKDNKQDHDRELDKESSRNDCTTSCAVRLGTGHVLKRQNVQKTGQTPLFGSFGLFGPFWPFLGLFGLFWAFLGLFGGF